MDTARWERIRELFDEARELDAGARDAFLDGACGDDAELRVEVIDLLRIDAGTDDPDDRDPLAAIVGGAALESDSVEGERIGPYRVIREMGRGGMGRVFLAERDDGEFDQTVALKLLGIGLSSPHLVERFRQERQILARLQHPNIARLLDGGVTADGQPFFALELVEGEPLDRYCDRHRLTVEERLRLFAEVCGALVYAHSALVIHRDLKPENILVTEEGRVRLLDFGIAKVMADEEGGPTATRTAMVAMTPAYASPEQVRGEPVGTATDVYSLGVILYELLTGCRPYDVDSRRPTEIERVVAELEPARPSTRVGRRPAGEPGGDTSVADQRRTDPGRLRRTLAGDLDVICMKALRKEPERRYVSVQALLDDVRRHLDGLPVTARPATLGYRLGKGVRRNRWAVGAAATVFLTSTTLVGFYTVRLADERDRAQVEAAKAGEVAAFLQGLFEVSDPSESLGETVTARELLDEGARRIDEGLADQPEVQVTMLRVIGEVYASLGLHAQARPLLERSLDLSLELYGDTHEEVALGQIALASIVQDGGELAESGALFRTGVETMRRVHGPDHPRVAEAIEALAYWLESNGDFEEAEEQYRLALGILRSTAPEGDERVVSVAASLGNFLRQLGRLDESEPLLREALTAQRTLYGNRHPDVASTARTLAALLRDQGRYSEADSLYQEVLSIRREVLGEHHPTVATTLNSYAILLGRMGETDRALAISREYLATLQTIYSEPHPNVAAAYHNLATSLHDVGELEEPIELFRKSIEMQDIVYRDGHPNRAFPRVGLASVFRDRGTSELAEPLGREALAIRRESLPPGHRYTGEALSGLGQTLMDLGRHAEAEPLLLEAYEIFVNAEGPEARRTLTTRRHLADLYDALDQPDRAAEYRASAAS
jgi:serine/threonine-protein kinase